MVHPAAVRLSSRMQGQAAAGSSSGKAGGDNRSGVEPDAEFAASQAIAAAAAATKAGGTAEPAFGAGTGGSSGQCEGDWSCIAGDVPSGIRSPALLAAVMPLMPSMPMQLEMHRSLPLCTFYTPACVWLPLKRFND